MKRRERPEELSITRAASVAYFHEVTQHYKAKTKKRPALAPATGGVCGWEKVAGWQVSVQVWSMIFVFFLDEMLNVTVHFCWSRKQEWCRPTAHLWLRMVLELVRKDPNQDQIRCNSSPFLPEGIWQFLFSGGIPGDVHPLFQDRQAEDRHV